MPGECAGQFLYRVARAQHLPPVNPEPEVPLVEAAIRGVERAYDVAWQAGDLDGLLACLIPRGVFNESGHFTGSTHARVLTNTRYAAPRFGLANAQGLRSLSERGLASGEDVEGFEREQMALDREGRYFYSVMGYAYVGRRSPAA